MKPQERNVGNLISGLARAPVHDLNRMRSRVLSASTVQAEAPEAVWSVELHPRFRWGGKGRGGEQVCVYMCVLVCVQMWVRLFGVYRAA
jgi:hypothetical protein